MMQPKCQCHPRCQCGGDGGAIDCGCKWNPLRNGEIQMPEEAATLPILSEDGEDAAEKSFTGLGAADRGSNASLRRLTRLVKEKFSQLCAQFMQAKLARFRPILFA